MQNRQFLQVSAIVCDLKQHLQKHLPKSSSHVNTLWLKIKLGVRKEIAIFFNILSFANSIFFFFLEKLLKNYLSPKKYKTIFSNSS